MNNKNNFYYNITDIMGYNALFNYIIGERGVGKTFSAKEYVINKFIKKGEEFVYVRRYNTELEEAVGTSTKQKFFEQIITAGKFKEHKLTNTKDTFKIDGNICGYAIALSTSMILKSTSFDKVTTIIFDEFIIDKGCYHYLPNEVEAFLELYETIARLRNVKVLFLGNAISSSNPYFLYFDLSLPYNSTHKIFKNGEILVNYIKNENYRAVKKASRFGKLIAGTKYSEYAIDNVMFRDSNTFVKKKSGSCKFYFKLKYQGTIYGIWLQPKENVIYISYDYDEKCPIEFVVELDDHNEVTFLLRSRTSVHIQNLIYYYQNSLMRFESQKIKNEFIKVMYKFIKY